MSRETVNLKVMHWNILAQGLCINFDKINSSAPILNWKNRIRLIREHFIQVDADIIGLVNCDALGGDFSDCIYSLIIMMKEIGYANKHFDACDNVTS